IDHGAGTLPGTGRRCAGRERDTSRWWRQWRLAYGPRGAAEPWQWSSLWTSAPPEGRFSIGLIANSQLGRLEPRLAAPERLDPGCDEPGSKERPFHRIGRLSGKEHLLDVVDQRVEKVCAPRSPDRQIE